MVTRKWTQAAALTATFTLFAPASALAQPAPERPAPGSPNASRVSDDRGSLADANIVTAAQPTPAPAPAPAPKAPQVAEIHHAPISSAKVGEPLSIHVSIERPQLLRSSGVVYRVHQLPAAGERTAPEDKWFYVKLLRTDEDYAATIPAEHVTPGGLGYAIEMEYLDGTRVAVFAARDDLQQVVVREDVTDVREKWLMDRVDKRRSLVSATGEFVRFGYENLAALPCAKGETACSAGSSYKPTVDDQYWRVDASYTYRPMRTVAEFGFRLGVVRGTRPRVENPPDEYTAKAYEVGLNYAGANVRFRVASIFHVDLDALGSVTEIGFSAGGGMALLFGDPLGIHFTAGWQMIGWPSDTTYFGTRFYTKLDLPVSDRFMLAPSIEVTDMPHAERFGVRLLADGLIQIGHGFALGLRGGYQARVSRSGGPTLGATVQLGF